MFLVRIRITVVRLSWAKAAGIGFRFYCPVLKGGAVKAHPIRALAQCDEI
jgi:hypothetical protein